MSLGSEDSGDKRKSVRPLMPPFVLFRDFLDETVAAGLLDHVLSRQGDFTSMGVGLKCIANPAIRVSTGLRDLENYRELFKTKILGLVPQLIAQLQVTPFEAARLETELVAHGDGAFFKRHVDTQTNQYDEIKYIRVLSGVYYFNAQPKAFSGGALRLYAIGGKPDEDFVDIAPTNNSLLVFPSWASHEVMPVSCPAGRFIDSRFAVNCWVHRKKTFAT